MFNINSLIVKSNSLRLRQQYSRPGTKRSIAGGKPPSGERRAFGVLYCAAVTCPA